MSDDHGRVWLAAGHDQDAVEICRTGSPAYALTPVNSRRFYSGDRAGDVTLWEVRGTDALRLRVVDKHEGPVFGVDLLGGECVSVGATGELRTPSGITVVASVALFAVCADDTHRLTVVGDASGHLHVIDRGERQEIPLHTDAIRSLVLDFPWVVTSSKDGTAKAFNIRTGFTGVLWEGPDYGYEISLSPDRTAVALVHGGGELVVRRFGKRLADLTDQDLETLIAAHG
ncbi:hypothetical protein ACFQ1S_13445 [Kibdelosporangium lantanae]|uniref:WD40 repeat domain-containing protein n=1 Tax=Kibdelosporangium lantanae TaxID=1497396 RepID=A0ABW3M701_9PSEU